ncbi:MAG: hypothetical protein R3C59_25875 [Planctomycetaceae bacterium]
MSTIRFVHTDYFRLGTPLSGIAQPPTWLQQLATASVRQAVRNVLETAIAQRVHFLLIAGSVCDCGDHEDSAAQWLDEQLVPVRRAGIRIVTAVDGHGTTANAQGIGDLLLGRGESLQCTVTTDGRVQLETSRQGLVRNADLSVTIGQSSVAAQTTQLVYNAVPALQPGTVQERTSDHGWLSQSAGAVQSINSSETGDRGCMVVNADVTARHLSSHFVVTNPIRFASEHLDLVSTTTTDRLVADITNASRSLQRTAEQTVVVDWTVQSRLTGNPAELLQLDEAGLLTRLRNQLESGHQGIWPRRIQLTGQTGVVTDPAARPAEQEYVDVVTGADGGYPRQSLLHTFGGNHEELVAGLQLLHRVA